MPVLTVARQELFAQGLASGMSVHDAYREAGFGHDGQDKDQALSSACHIKAKPHVAARIEELLTQTHAERTAREENRKDLAAFEEAMGQAEILRGLRTVFELAISRSTITTKTGELVEGDPVNLGAANRALELMGKQEGMFADTKIIKRDTDSMSRDQLREAIEAIDNKLKRIGGDDAKLVDAQYSDA